MDFSDTKEEARFRTEVKEWISKEAPSYLCDSLSASGFGSTRTGEYDPLEEAKKWQKKNVGQQTFCWPNNFFGKQICCPNFFFV